jgi:hypothetical protein
MTNFPKSNEQFKLITDEKLVQLHGKITKKFKLIK